MRNRCYQLVGDIAVCEVNLLGNDYSVGDIHGNLAILKKAHEDLSPNDRFIIVGDLVDRGEDSLGVIEYVIENNSKQDKAPIIALKGNHEISTLDTIKALEKIAAILRDACYTPDELGQEFEVKDATQITSRICQLQFKYDTDEYVMSRIVTQCLQRNGGRWLLELFKSELDANQIRINASGTVDYDPSSRIKKVIDFIESSPFIVTTNGNNAHIPYVAAHANMPFDDDVLQQRITQGGKLTDSEITQTVWDKQTASGEMPNNKRRNNSRLLIVGHQIVAAKGIRAVREESNTINIDWGAVFSGQLLRINLTEGTLNNIECNPYESWRETLSAKMLEVSNHLKKAFRDYSQFSLFAPNKRSALSDISNDAAIKLPRRSKRKVSGDL